MIANNADIFYANLNGDSPLKFALTLREGREDWMINSHTIGAGDGAGNTPLHLAAEWQILPMIPYLIDKGADINARNANNETPLFNAVKTDSPEAVKAFYAQKPAAIDADTFFAAPILIEDYIPKIEGKKLLVAGKEMKLEKVKTGEAG